MPRFFHYTNLQNYERAALQDRALVPSDAQPTGAFPLKLVWLSNRVDCDPMGFLYAPAKPGQIEHRLMPFEDSCRSFPLVRVEVPGDGLIDWRSLVRRTRADREAVRRDIEYWRSQGANPVRDWWASTSSILREKWLVVDMYLPSKEAWLPFTIPDDQLPAFAAEFFRQAKKTSAADN